MTYTPRFPHAPHNYDAQNETQFRAVVARAVQDTFGHLNDRLASGNGFPTSVLGWSHDIGFSASDNDTVAWGSGSIVLSDGTTYAINAGNTGNMTAVTYIFLDIGVSATALQTTTTASNAVGANRILVAVAQDVASGKDAQFQVFGGADDSELVLVTADVIAANTITANEIAANTITATEIAAGTITANEIQAGTITATEIAAGTITANEIAAGTITADKLNVSALSAVSANMGTLTAGVITAGNITISASAEQILFGSATGPGTGVGIFMGLDSAAYQFRVGDPAGARMLWDGTGLYVNNPVLTSPAAGSEPSILGWTHDITFSASDNDTVAWGSGTITLMEGTTYSIAAGNTGNMAEITYIYLDIATSATALQTSTTASDAVGSRKILVAVAQNVASGKDALFQVFGGADDQKLSLLTADVIAADTITANEIASNTITANEMSVSTLSAITADMGSLTAGSIVIGSTNRIWLNDSADGALNIGGSTKASAPFRVTAAGALTATNATITGTLTAGTIVAAASFTGTNPTFTSTVTIEAGDGDPRVFLSADSNNGLVVFYAGADDAGVIQARGSGTTLGLDIRAQGSAGEINFSGPTGGTVPPAILLNNGNRFGPHAFDGSSAGTGASTAYTTLHTLTWPGDGSFQGCVAEFWGTVTGTNDVKRIGVLISSGTRDVPIVASAGDAGAWLITVRILEVTTSSQTLLYTYTEPDGTTGIMTATRSINTLTTDLVLDLQGQTDNSSDEITCTGSYGISICDGGG